MDEKRETFLLLLRVKGKHLLEKRRHKLEHLELTNTNFMECMLFSLRKMFLKVKNFVFKDKRHLYKKLLRAFFSGTL